jgi:TolA-binding protein
LQAQKNQVQESVTQKTQSLSTRLSQLTRQNQDLESLNQSLKKQLVETNGRMEYMERTVKEKNLKVQQLAEHVARLEQAPSRLSPSGFPHDSKEFLTLQKQMRGMLFWRMVQEFIGTKRAYNEKTTWNICKLLKVKSNPSKKKTNTTKRWT